MRWNNRLFYSPLHERVFAIWGASRISMPLYNCFVNVCLLGMVRAPLIEKGNEIYEWVMYVWFFKERILWWSREGNKNDIVEANLLDKMPNVQSHLKSFEMSLNIETRRSLQDSYKPQEINNTGWFDEWRPGAVATARVGLGISEIFFCIGGILHSYRSFSC